MKHGFTLIEILMALVIFAFAIIGLSQSNVGSKRNVLLSEGLQRALQLAQAKMTEMEIKFQKQIDGGGLAGSFGKDEGSFDAPFADYHWKAELKENTLKLGPADMLKFMVTMGLDQDTAEQQLEQSKLVLTNLNKLLKDNYAELTVEVQWSQFGRKNALPLVTHLIPRKPKIEVTTTTDSTNGAPEATESP